MFIYFEILLGPQPGVWCFLHYIDWKQ